MVNDSATLRRLPFARSARLRDVGRGHGCNRLSRSSHPEERADHIDRPTRFDDRPVVSDLQNRSRGEVTRCCRRCVQHESGSTRRRRRGSGSSSWPSPITTQVLVVLWRTRPAWLARSAGLFPSRGYNTIHAVAPVMTPASAASPWPVERADSCPIEQIPSQLLNSIHVSDSLRAGAGRSTEGSLVSSRCGADSGSRGPCDRAGAGLRGRSSTSASITHRPCCGNPEQDRRLRDLMRRTAIVDMHAPPGACPSWSATPLRSVPVKGPLEALSTWLLRFGTKGRRPLAHPGAQGAVLG